MSESPKNRIEKFLDRDVFDVLGEIIRTVAKGWNKYQDMLDDPKRPPDDPNSQGLTRHAQNLADKFKRRWPPEA